MEVATARPGYELWRPNREKAQSKTTKAIVAFVLFVSAGLLLIVTLGGWERLQGPSVGMMTLAWAGLYVVFALLILRWNRGLLPVTAALAVILGIFAVIAAPDWFARSKEGLDSPALDEDLIGLLTILIVPVQILLIAITMVAFNQEWHVEEERPIGGEPLAGEDGDDSPPTEAEADQPHAGEAEPEDDLPPDERSEDTDA